MRLPSPTGQTDPAEHGRGDDDQLEPLHARRRSSRSRSASDQHAGDGRRRPGEDEEEELVALDPDAGDPRRRRVAADGVDVAAELGAREEDEGEGDEDDGDQTRDRHPEDPP